MWLFKSTQRTHKVELVMIQFDIDEQADLERIALLEKIHETVYITAEPGDVYFFIAIFTFFAPNDSNYSRRTLIVCFNTNQIALLRCTFMQFIVLECFILRFYNEIYRLQTYIYQYLRA